MNNFQSQTKISASIRTRVQMWILPHSFHKQHKLQIKQKMCYICSTHSKNNWSIYGICIDSASPRKVTQSNFNSSEKKIIGNYVMRFSAYTLPFTDSFLTGYSIKYTLSDISVSSIIILYWIYLCAYSCQKENAP